MTSLRTILHSDGSMMKNSLDRVKYSWAKQYDLAAGMALPRGSSVGQVIKTILMRSFVPFGGGLIGIYLAEKWLPDAVGKRRLLQAALSESEFSGARYGGCYSAKVPKAVEELRSNLPVEPEFDFSGSRYGGCYEAK